MAARIVAPTTLKLEWDEGWNRHHTFGADGLRRHSDVTLHLLEGGKAKALDKGTLTQSSLDRTWGLKVTKTDWKNTWQGSWAVVGKRLQLKLNRSENKCEKTTEARGEKKQTQGCAAAPKRVVLDCDDAMVKVEPPLGNPKAAGKPQPAWLCIPRGKSAELGGTPSPWVFGQKRCLEVTSGGPMRYALCKK